MMKNNEFEDILDDCLERLTKGETLEHCLQRYPEQAAQLEPLLRITQEVKRASAISPRAEFKARARYEFRSAVQSVTQRKPSLFGLKPRWAMAAMISSILLLAGGGTAMAANDSMPDSPLYPVKLASEQVQLTFTPSDVGKARVCAMLADRRVAEIVYVAGKGDAQELGVLTRRLDERLVLLARLASAQEATGEAVLEAVPEAGDIDVVESAPPEETPVVGRHGPAPAPKAGHAPRGGRSPLSEGNERAELRMAIAYYAANHPARLRAVLREAPESAKPGLLQAIAISESGYDEVLEALD